jgi:broad specificity phosphatase PhoE
VIAQQRLLNGRGRLTAPRSCCFPLQVPLTPRFLFRVPPLRLSIMETDWSDAGQHTRCTDIPLNAGGDEHARLLGGRLKGERFSRIFASPLPRVRRTCELAGFAEHSEIDPDLTEWNYGSYEGRLTVDVHRERPDWYLYKDGAPGCESPEQVATRADRFIKHVRPLEGDVAAFSSAQTIRMIVARWLGLRPLDAKFFYTARPVSEFWDTSTTDFTQ